MCVCGERKSGTERERKIGHAESLPHGGGAVANCGDYRNKRSVVAYATSLSRSPPPPPPPPFFCACIYTDHSRRPFCFYVDRLSARGSSLTGPRGNVYATVTVLHHNHRRVSWGGGRLVLFFYNNKII